MLYLEKAWVTAAVAIVLAFLLEVDPIMSGLTGFILSLVLSILTPIDDTHW